MQKRDRSGNMYAMKYVHKGECAERGALKNVAREVEILSQLEHPCLVNLWFSFQGKPIAFHPRALEFHTDQPPLPILRGRSTPAFQIDSIILQSPPPLILSTIFCPPPLCSLD